MAKKIPKCTQCNAELKKIKWEITASFIDPVIEVEQSFYQCEADGNYFVEELPTGNPSKYAQPQEPDNFYQP